MRIKSKTVMDQMNTEKQDDVLADLEAKHGSSAPTGSAFFELRQCPNCGCKWDSNDPDDYDESDVCVRCRRAD